MYHTAKLKNVKFIKRKNYGRLGIAINFHVENIGEVGRTFNIPKTLKGGSSGLSQLKNELDLVIPESYLDSHFLLTNTISEQLEGKTFSVKVLPTGNKKFPFNIVEIKHGEESYINRNKQVNT